LALAACGKDPKASGGAQTRSRSPRAPASALPEITPEHGFPAKVKSFNGDTALLVRAPRRILAGNASLLEILVELVEPERFAALPAAALSFSSLRGEGERWAEVPPLASFEAESILAAGPDLLLVHAYQLGATVDRVIEGEVPVVAFPVASSWNEILASIQSAARLVGEPERAEELLVDLRRRAARLKEAAPRNDLRVLPYGNYGSGGSTAGRGTTWQIMCELAGLRNAASEAGLEGHPSIDYEQLLAIDPDYFLIATGEEGATTSVEPILCTEPLLANLRAVRERRFLRLPEALYSTASHHLLRAAEMIAAQADGEPAAPVR